jgi:hypothetical protein
MLPLGPRVLGVCPDFSYTHAVLAVQVMFRNEPLLSLAVRRGVQATVIALIEAGANVNARDDVCAVRLRW